jgi:3,5-epimerase/4-reductase
LVGSPNIDWCEDHMADTLRTNVIGTLNIADLCSARGIHCTIYATGCIYEYDELHPIGGPGFTEEDKPNFDGEGPRQHIPQREVGSYLTFRHACAPRL